MSGEDRLSAPVPPEGTGQLVLYRTEDGRTGISCRLDGDSVWLTQAAIADLFQTTPQNITLHIRAIYQEGELREEATCKEYLQVRQEGSRPVSRRLKHYNLNVVLAVGYLAKKQPKAVHIFLAPQFPLFSMTSQNPGLPAEQPYIIIRAKAEVWPVIHTKEQNRMTETNAQRERKKCFFAKRTQSQKRTPPRSYCFCRTVTESLNEAAISVLT